MRTHANEDDGPSMKARLIHGIYVEADINDSVPPWPWRFISYTERSAGSLPACWTTTELALITKDRQDASRSFTPLQFAKNNGTIRQRRTQWRTIAPPLNNGIWVHSCFRALPNSTRVEWNEHSEAFAAQASFNEQADIGVTGPNQWAMLVTKKNQRFEII